MPAPKFTTPGLSLEVAAEATQRLQDRLVSLIDLELTLKHIHWNVVGPAFIGVHKMLDPQVDAVREMIDDVAERIATLGGSPNGLPGALVARRTWDDYDLARDGALAHLGALDVVYAGVVAAHREALDAFEELDPVTQDLLIDQTQALEQFHWFVRAHLEDAGGVLVTQGARTEHRAADQAAQASADQASRSTAKRTGKPGGNGAAKAKPSKDVAGRR